jgi:integrase
MNRCLNPACGKPFKAGNYGDRQLVCSSTYKAKCGAKCPGKSCPRCKGSRSFLRPCREWYKAHQLATSPPPRGLGDSWAKVVKAIDGLPLRHSVLLRVARATGLRKGELLGLTWGDVLEAGRSRADVSIRGKWSDVRGFELTKNGTSRKAYLDADARTALEDLYRVQVGGPPRATARIWRLSCAGAWAMWTSFQRRIGLENAETGEPFRFHDLRHTVGVELVAAGKIGLAQQVLGHRSINSTMRYATRTSAEVNAEVDAVRNPPRRKK